jgi:heme/copper-type cytochrome/quinol oxidase subunit 4
MTRGPATWATIIALALVNIGIAMAIVAAMGTASIGPLWVGILLLACGVAAGVVAISLWRQYLLALRER